MEHFLMREVTVDETKFEGIDIKVTRTRTSNGFCSISVRVNDKVALRFNTDANGGDYEIIAARVAEMLTEISDEPCLLPE